MREAICEWHAQSNSLRKGSQPSTVAFNHPRKKDNTVTKTGDAVGLQEHCSHVDGHKIAVFSFLLPATKTAHSASFYLH